MKIPKPDEKSVAFFKTVVPKDSRVSVRPMFGNLAAFVNGNMFTGIYGSDFFVRLSEDDQKELLKVKGATLFEPMKGRPMKEYVVLPRTWSNQASKTEPWIKRSLDWISKMPAKKKAKR